MQSNAPLIETQAQSSLEILKLGLYLIV